MKKLILILLLGLSSILYGQESITYVVDTIAYDTISNTALIGGTVKLNTTGAFDKPIYEVKTDAVVVYCKYRVIAINLGTINLQVRGVRLDKATYPDLWNYLTSNTIKNAINAIMDAHYVANPVFWDEFVYIQPEE